MNMYEVADALVVIDMQRAFVEGPGAIPEVGTVLPAVQVQIDAARAVGALVIFIQNDGRAGDSDEPESWGWELAFELHRDDAVVRKRHDDGFLGTDLERLLHKHHVEAISLCGTMSEMCVAATARTALELGYDVVLAHDSHGTYPVPPLGSGGPEVPAQLAARAAEWSLGDAIRIPFTSEAVHFRDQFQPTESGIRAGLDT